MIGIKNYNFKNLKQNFNNIIIFLSILNYTIYNVHAIY